MKSDMPLFFPLNLGLGISIGWRQQKWKSLRSSYKSFCVNLTELISTTCIVCEKEGWAPLHSSLEFSEFPSLNEWRPMVYKGEMMSSCDCSWCLHQDFTYQCERYSCPWLYHLYREWFLMIRLYSLNEVLSKSYGRLHHQTSHEEQLSSKWY
jgi:hypothetical protein